VLGNLEHNKVDPNSIQIEIPVAPEDQAPVDFK
jgi:hypothetical protein